MGSGRAAGKVDAVVLGGGDGAVIDPACRFKGLLPLAGKPMIGWVVDALRAADSVAGIAVVVPTAEGLDEWVDRVDKIVIRDGEFADNVLAGIESFRDERLVLLSTGDIPALTPEAVDAFVAECLERDAEFAYPLISRDDIMEQFPGSARTFFRLAAGEFTGGNVALVSPALARRCRDLGQRLFEMRKSPLKTVRMLGMRFVLGMLTGRLDPADVEVKAGEILGGRAIAVVTPHACLGADVDKPEDVVVAERVLYGRARAQREEAARVE